MKIGLRSSFMVMMVMFSCALHAQFKRYGLEGRVVYDLALYGSTLYAATDEGAYARYRYGSRDTGWVLLGLKGKTVRTIYPHQFGPIGYAVTAGVERKFGDSDSTLVYCSQMSDTAWAPADTGIARSEIGVIRSIRGFPTLAICGETFAGGGGLVYRRPPYPWAKVFDIGVGVTNVVRANDQDASIWVGGETGIFAPYIAVSWDKGLSWNTSFPNLGGDNACNSIAFAHGAAPRVFAGMEGMVITSVDSGKTWTVTTLSGTPYYFFGLAVYEYGGQAEAVYAGGSTNSGQFGLYRGNVSGTQWTSLLPPFSVQGSRCLTIEPGTLFIGTEGDGVLLYNFITPAVPNDPGVSQFSLEQNFPNPFNSTTTIRFSVSSRRDLVRRADGQISNSRIQSHEDPSALGIFVSMKVYDVLGREMRTLVEERIPTGVHEITFDASGLPSGVYFYRMSVSPLARRADQLESVEPRSAETDRDLVPTDGRDGQAGSFVATKRLILLR